MKKGKIIVKFVLNTNEFYKIRQLLFEYLYKCKINNIQYGICVLLYNDCRKFSVYVREKNEYSQ